MNDDLVIFLRLIVCVAAEGGFHWRVWRSSGPGFLAGGFSRASRLGRVAGWQTVRLLVPAGALLLLVGPGETTPSPLVPERIALAALGLTAQQLLTGLATFIAAIRLTRSSARAAS